jgi:hypothetical protein
MMLEHRDLHQPGVVPRRSKTAQLLLRLCVPSNETTAISIDIANSLDSFSVPAQLPTPKPECPHAPPTRHRPDGINRHEEAAALASSTRGKSARTGE